MGYEWLWKDKKPKPKKMEFEVSNQEQVFMKNKIKMVLTIDLKSPVTEDVITHLKNSKIDFLMPPATTITSVEVAEVHFLGRGGE